MTSDAWCRAPVTRTRFDARPIARSKVLSVVGRVLRSSLGLAVIALIGGSINTAASIPAAAQPRDRAVADFLEWDVGQQAERGRVPSHRVLTGTLGAGESERVQVHTCSDMEYTAHGFCGSDCSDLDLTAYKELGEVMDSDVLPDAVPMVHFTPTACGFTTLSVKMVECNGSCEWAVQLYIDDPTAPSGVPGAGNADSPAWSSDWDTYFGTYRTGQGDTNILRHESQLVVFFPFSHDRNGSTRVRRPTDEPHVFQLERDSDGITGELVRFEVDDGVLTAVSGGVDRSPRGKQRDDRRSH